jgi:hypothetical protein
MSIDSLIDTASDEELTRAVFDAFNKRYGNKIDAKKYAKEARVIILSDHANGIIRNGGFRYLFEGDFPGDPGFRLTLQAFEILGVKPAVTAFKKALAVFPNSRPPKDIDKRLEAYLNVPFTRRQKIDETFWSANDEIVRRQAQFIRHNRETFCDLN